MTSSPASNSLPIRLGWLSIREEVLVLMHPWVNRETVEAMAIRATAVGPRQTVDEEIWMIVNRWDTK